MNQKHLQTIYDTEEDRQLARILSTLIWTLLGVYLFVICTGLFYNRDWNLIAAALGGIALLSVAMVLLWREHLRASSLLVVLGTLGTVTTIATVGQGIRDLALVAFPIIFVFAGLTLNRMLFRLCVGLALAAVCWLVLGEIYGWFVPVPFVGEMANWLYLIVTTIILLVAALAVDLLATNMRQSLELARQEISQRKYAEQTLQESEEKFKAQYKSIPVPTFTWQSVGDDLILVDYNDAGLDFTKGQIANLLGKTASAVYRDAPDIFNEFIECSRTRSNSKVERWHRLDSSGEMKFVTLNYAFVPPDLVMVHIEDITERKRTEEELKNSEKRFHALIKHGRDNISLLAADGTLLWESPSIDSVLSYKPNQFVGENIFQLIHPDDQAWIGDLYAQVIQMPGSIQEGEFRLLHIDGTWRWIECSAANLLDEPGVHAIVLNYRDITNRKQAEEKLRESEEKFRTAFMISPDSINISRLEDGMYVSINQGFIQLTGYSESDVIGKTSLDIHIWDNPGDRQRLVEGLKKDGFVRNLEARFLRKDGSITYGLISAAVIDLGGIPHIFSITRDINELKHTEAALRENEEKFRRLFETSRDFLYITSMDGRIIEVNKAASVMSGYSIEELKRINITEIYLDPHERGMIVKEISQWGYVENFEIKGKRKDGVVIDALVTSTIIRDGDGNVIGFQGSIKNITERKQMDEALKQSEAKYRRMVQTANEGVIVLDTSTQMTLVNQQMADMLGYTIEELLGRKLESLLFEEDLSDHQAQMTLGAQGQNAVYERCFRRKDGSRLWTLISATSTTDAEGNFDGAFSMITDITERKRAEAKIHAALEEKETLLREVHHRVKNNLQVIIALIKMQARSIQDAGTTQFLKALEGQAHTMALVYEQLYQSKNLAQVNMAQYLGQLTANVLDTYGRRDAIQLHLDASLALDVAQATPCGLIVNELFSNILKYAFPPGFEEIPTVNITLRQDGETYYLTVSDNGVGFPPGYDWRASQSMGLRLINLWVTHQLGGTLTINGKPGTTFAIVFDLKD